MGTVPQCQDYPALARRSHAPARDDPNAGPANPSRPRGPTLAAECRKSKPPNWKRYHTVRVIQNSGLKRDGEGFRHRGGGLRNLLRCDTALDCRHGSRLAAPKVPVWPLVPSTLAK